MASQQSRKFRILRAPPEGVRLHHFWQARFHDFNVWSPKKHIEKLRPIHHVGIATS